VAQARILLIDHRPEHLKQPVLRLELEGYRVDEASSADEGLDKLRATRHDLLLLDAELPGDRDGWSILKEIREDPELENTRVIVFMAGQGETGKLGLYEVQGELRRPFPIGELLEKVKNALGG
jgi:two-component system, OmpR family, KDP operon response regulator KdpE